MCLTEVPAKGLLWDAGEAKVEERQSRALIFGRSVYGWAGWWVAFVGLCKRFVGLPALNHLPFWICWSVIEGIPG
jgi:hypothetical protein